MPALRSKIQREAVPGEQRVPAPRTSRTRSSRPGKNPKSRHLTNAGALEPRGHSSRRAEESPVLKDASPREGYETDPEPDMDSGRASVRNMRSKCRCSYVLQFTFRRAVCCVLHRPPSQVIHCAVLSLQTCKVRRTRRVARKVRRL